MAEKANYPVVLMCRVMGVSRSGLYAWARRGVSARQAADAELSEQIRAIQRDERDVAALSDPDADREVQIARDREQRKWLSDLAEDFDLRLRPTI